MSTIKNVVLVHGSFVDGAGWESVFHLLARRGRPVPSASSSSLQKYRPGRRSGHYGPPVAWAEVW